MWKEFGRDSVDFLEMKEDILKGVAEWSLEPLGTLTKTWKPVTTRWLYEYCAICWIFTNWDKILWCYRWQVARASSQKAKRVSARYACCLIQLLRIC